MYKKSWFTFLEILIVMIIISVLFVAFRSSFQVKNKDIFYGQACIETIYGEVNNFLYAAISSKSLNSWWTQIFPETYIITFSGQVIDLWYQESEGPYTIYSSIPISENTNNYCSSNKYTIVMTWDSYEVYISKWLQNNQNTNFFLSGTTGVSTWGNTFLQCDNTLTWCKTMAYFQSDTRALSIQKKMCLAFEDNWDCSERDN